MIEASGQWLVASGLNSGNPINPENITNSTNSTNLENFKNPENPLILANQGSDNFQLNTERLKIIDEISRLIFELKEQFPKLAQYLSKARDNFSTNQENIPVKNLTNLLTQIQQNLNKPESVETVKNLVDEVIKILQPSKEIPPEYKLVLALSKNDFASANIAAKNIVQTAISQQTQIPQQTQVPQQTQTPQAAVATTTQTFQTILNALQELKELGIPTELKHAPLKELETVVLQKTGIEIDQNSPNLRNLQNFFYEKPTYVTISLLPASQTVHFENVANVVEIPLPKDFPVQKIFSNILPPSPPNIPQQPPPQPPLPLPPPLLPPPQPPLQQQPILQQQPLPPQPQPPPPQPPLQQQPILQQPILQQPLPEPPPPLPPPPPLQQQPIPQQPIPQQPIPQQPIPQQPLPMPTPTQPQQPIPQQPLPMPTPTQPQLQPPPPILQQPIPQQQPLPMPPQPQQQPQPPPIPQQILPSPIIPQKIEMAFSLHQVTIPQNTAPAPKFILQPWPVSTLIPKEERDFWLKTDLPLTPQILKIRDTVLSFGKLPENPEIVKLFANNLHELSLQTEQGTNISKEQANLLWRVVQNSQLSTINYQLLKYQPTGNYEGELFKNLPEPVKRELQRELPVGKTWQPETLQKAVEKILEKYEGVEQHTSKHNEEIKQVLQNLKEQIQWTRIDQDTRLQNDRENIFYFMHEGDLQKGRLKIKDERKGGSKKQQGSSISFSIETKTKNLGDVHADLTLSKSVLNIRLQDSVGTASEAVQAERENLAKELTDIGITLGELLYGKIPKVRNLPINKPEEKRNSGFDIRA